MVTFSVWMSVTARFPLSGGFLSQDLAKEWAAKNYRSFIIRRSQVVNGRHYAHGMVVFSFKG